MALVTGAAGGLGAAVCRVFAAEGASVIVTDANGHAAGQLAEQIPGARALELDVANEAHWRASARDVRTRFGRLDVLVNNAGVVRFEPITACSTESFMDVLNVNLLGVFLGMRELVPLMARPASIVNISSCAGLEGINGACSYVASKWGVTGLTKAAALEFGHRGIRVNSVHPSAMATEMIAAKLAEAGGVGLFGDHAIQRAATPDEVAAMVTFLASDESSFCTGGAYLVDGGHMAGRIVDSMPVG